MAIQLPSKTTPIRSITIKKADITRIFERLLGHVNTEADAQMATVIQLEGESDEEFEIRKADLRERAFRISVTIQGKDGETLYGDSAELFDSPILPDTISGVYMTNSIAYEGVAGVKPSNRFALNLDFS